MSQNISSIEASTSATLFASQAKQNGEHFPINMLPNFAAIKKDAPNDLQRMEDFVKSPNYGVDSAMYYQMKSSIG